MLAGLRELFPLLLQEDLLQPLSFDRQSGPRGLGHFLCKLQQVLSHDYKDTPTETVLKSFGIGKINNGKINNLRTSRNNEIPNRLRKIEHGVGRVCSRLAWAWRCGQNAV